MSASQWSVVFAVALTFSAEANAQRVVKKQYPRDNQPHPDAAHRPSNWSDARVVESAAQHAVIYAKQRYGIADFVSDVDYERAAREMDDYLTWKYGGAAQVVARWTAAGYQHFDSYVAEAGAALMGMELPGPRESITLTKELTTWLKAQVDSAQKDSHYAPCAAGSADMVATAAGVPCELLLRLAGDAARQVVERLTVAAPTFKPRVSFNIDDSSVEFMVLLRRNPPLSLRPGVRPTKIVTASDGGVE